MLDVRNEIISAGKLNEMLETKRKNTEELKEKLAIDHITEIAFTMHDQYEISDKDDDNEEDPLFYSKIAEKMGFLLSGKGEIIRFDYTRPGSTASGIMHEVKVLKCDIIQYVNKSIKDWIDNNPDNKDDLYISCTVNLDKFLSKFKVGKSDLFSYSFDWLEKMLKDAGYKVEIFYQGSRDDELIYDVTLTWDWAEK
jgi:hypothetical protein